jgi:phosphoribosyl 1,2-cyclic phosphate phosphodiesterase
MSQIDITFLGTCACDFSPRLQGDCKDRFDFDARRSSAMLIGENMLVDCGTHTLDSLRIIGKDLREISDIFITHLHDDHYEPDHIRSIAAGDRPPLRLWVRDTAEVPEMEGVEVIKMKQFERYEVADGIYIFGMPANHDTSSFPQHFLIELCGKTVFYGCDGGWLFNDTYYFLSNRAIDLAVLEATVGDYLGDFRASDHNSIPMLRVLIPSLRTIGALKDDTVIYLSHIAPSLHKPHADTVKIAEGFGAKVAYDGLKITI